MARRKHMFSICQRWHFWQLCGAYPISPASGKTLRADKESIYVERLPLEYHAAHAEHQQQARLPGLARLLDCLPFGLGVSNLGQPARISTTP